MTDRWLHINQLILSSVLWHHQINTCLKVRSRRINSITFKKVFLSDGPAPLFKKAPLVCVWMKSWQADSCVGPHTDTGGPWCLPSAVSQCGDVTTERRVQGEECVLGRRGGGGGSDDGGAGGGSYWLVASSIIAVEQSAVTYTSWPRETSGWPAEGEFFHSASHIKMQTQIHAGRLLLLFAIWCYYFWLSMDFLFNSWLNKLI